MVEPRGTTWVPQFRHVEYDWSAAAQKAAREGRPDWEVALRTGYARSRAS